jgi:PEGA domain
MGAACLLGLVAAAASMPQPSIFGLERYLPSFDVHSSVSSKPTPAQGTLMIDSQPAGAQVSVDGAKRGVTPLKLPLRAGEHSVELRNATATRAMRVTVPENGIASHYIELAAAEPPAASVGRLEVTSDPAGARVTLDGSARGVTPVSLGNVAAGRHTVVIAAEGASVTRMVNVSAGSTSSVVVSLAGRSVTAGWIEFDVPVELKILEDGKMIGTTAADRIMVAAGRHDLLLSSEQLDVNIPLTVQVNAGKIASPTVPMPSGSLSINSTPWAEVFVDGKSVGTTPLANLPIAVGSHEITYRHPQMGERRQSVVVKAHSPTRIGFSFSK